MHILHIGYSQHMTISLDSHQHNAYSVLPCIMVPFITHKRHNRQHAQVPTPPVLLHVFNSSQNKNYSNYFIGVGRFRILGGPRFRILGGPRGANSQQAHDVVMTSMRRNDVASTSFRRHVPTRFLTNQYQIITFLILKPDIIENSRLELRGIVLLIIILPFYLIHFVIL